MFFQRSSKLSGILARGLEKSRVFRRVGSWEVRLASWTAEDGNLDSAIDGSGGLMEVAKYLWRSNAIGVNYSTAR